MDICTKYAKLLGSYEVLLDYAIEGLKGETIVTGAKLGEYLEKRVKEINQEINTQQYEYRNNVKGNKEGIQSNTEAVAG
jgi:hypothetical protein